MGKLKPLHKSIADAYIGNGFNGQAAYLKVRPKVTINTAKVNACRILAKPEVQEYILNKQDQTHVKTISSRDYLIKQAHRIGETAEQSEKLDTALKAIDSKAKLAGIYTQEMQPMEGYADLLKTLVIVNGNVNVNTKEQTSNQAIDITPIDLTPTNE